MRFCRERFQVVATPSFQLKSAQFLMSGGVPQGVDFLGPNAQADRSHITLITGANGSSKSRILASVVDRFCELHDEMFDKKVPKRYGSSETHGLVCERLDSRGDRGRGSSNASDGTVLPTKILVLSNLVMDRFRFVPNDPDDDEFYQYLGVRQATNLMTTGSMQRSVAEAVMRLYADRAKRDLFQDWVELVFGGTREIALTFDRVSISQIEKFLSDTDPVNALVERMASVRGNARPRDERLLEGAHESAPQLIHLFQYLLSRTQNAESFGSRILSRSGLVLRLDALSYDALVELAELQPAVATAIRSRFLSWPNVAIEGDAWQGWTEFGQLSSGEQNILSTGAKLIAHAEPGCLIAIDEPEVSLNTAWQQHYTDLVSRSLAEAPGSHVLIATHSPHLISSLPFGESSIVQMERDKERLTTSTIDAEFEGWGAESVLYQVLDIPSASSFGFQRELASILLHIQENGTDRNRLDEFLEKTNRLNLEGADALEQLVASIRYYRDALP